MVVKHSPCEERLSGDAVHRWDGIMLGELELREV